MKQFQLFKLGSRSYGLGVEQIQEIVDQPALHYIPCAPNYYCGAMNFHGEVLPVLDLGLYLAEEGNDSAVRVIILASRIAALGLRVETARRIVSVNPLELQPVSDPKPFGFSQTTFDLQGEVVSIFDLTQLLQRLKENAAATAQEFPA